MNYPYLIPGQQGEPENFVASVSGRLGFYDKSVAAIAQLNVDYSAIPSLSVPRTVISFRVTPGGSPQLAITQPQVSNGLLLTFTLQGGIGGRAYTVVIGTSGPSGEIRSDVLDVNVLGGDCGPCQKLNPVINNGATSADGSLYVNTAPRMFVSATPPVGANVMDQWWNTTERSLYTFITDGITTYWTLL